jgi:hypothetical protein
MKEEKAVDDILQLTDSKAIYIGLCSTVNSNMPTYMYNM